MLALAGCRTPEPESPSAELTNSGEVSRGPDLGRGAPRVRAEAAYHMYVADPVRHVCAGSVPFFDFDSSQTRETDQPTMQALAECMISGPLKGKSILLIGKNDPRGSDDYNERLGLERAERVKQYLIDHGIDAGRVEVESHGKQGATSAPEGWPKDRRVEIQLAPAK